MLYVKKDLSAVTKAVFDQWESRKGELNHNYLYVANARVTPLDILTSVKKGRPEPPALSTAPLADDILQRRARMAYTFSSQRLESRIEISCSQCL